MNIHFIKAFILFSFLSLTISCSESEQQESKTEQAPRVVKTENIDVFSGEVERHITGRLQAAENTTLSFEVNGVVKQVYVSLGQSFTRGQLLAELDNEIYLLSVTQRKGQLGEASASKTEAKQALARALSLKTQNLVSQASVDNAQAAFDIADERVNSALSALNIASKNLADTKLYAPYDGMVSSRLIEPSQQVSVQSPVFTIQGKANLEVEAVVPESLVSRLELGKEVNVRIPAFSDSHNFKASLTEIGAQASIANAFPVTITFNQAYQNLLPGMSAEIILPLKDKPLLQNESRLQKLYKIPLSAIATDDKGQFILSVDTSADSYISRKHYVDITQTLPKHVLAHIKSFSTAERSSNKIEVVTAGIAFIEDQQSIMPLSKTKQIYNQ